MTLRWALAWMVVGLVAVSYPLWRPPEPVAPPVGDVPWLRDRVPRRTTVLSPEDLVGIEIPPARERRTLPPRPSLDPAPLPRMSEPRFDAVDLVVLAEQAEGESGSEPGDPRARAGFAELP